MASQHPVNAISVKMLSKQLVYNGFSDKYMITQILGNATAHAPLSPMQWIPGLYSPRLL